MLDENRIEYMIIGGHEVSQTSTACTICSACSCPRAVWGTASSAVVDHKGSGLVVKLPKARVAELVEQGKGQPFAPAKKVFKEWLSVLKPDSLRWRALLKEGVSFVTRQAPRRNLTQSFAGPLVWKNCGPMLASMPRSEIRCFRAMVEEVEKIWWRLSGTGVTVRLPKVHRE